MKKRDYLWNKISNDKAEDILISFYDDIPNETRSLIYQMIVAVSKNSRYS
ncbi:hypothetical protein LEP1GSC065_3332 [Leptospira kirschneri serovar Sokoine str. RM1]|nr:hypothetical protein LEP1GSC065_3332 [Leptospira kirschneri serovar Sokoine str. RM1]OCA00060.1 Transcriptional regulator [Leptospira interrogans serovar Copenhageni/Icterohaemorrhagiae]